MGKLDLFTLAPESYKLDNGKTVSLKRLTGAQRVEWFAYLDKHDPKDSATSLEIGARLLCWVICDSDGKRMFADDEIDAIKDFDAKVFDGLANHALEMNALTSKAQADVKKK